MNTKRWARTKHLGKGTACATLATIAVVVFAGCGGTTPTLGGGGTVATGGAGGATAENASSQLEKCSQSLGTLSVVPTVDAVQTRFDRARAAHDDPAVELFRGC